MRSSEAIANQLNTYRVLLTRARYETVIYVPRGDAGRSHARPGRLRGYRAVSVGVRGSGLA